MNKDSIVRRISRWADITPNACCFQGYGESFSYADLERRSNGLAGLLRATPGERERGPVLCFGDLNFHMIACFLACIKMGRPYIPVDSATPAERIAAICRTAGCKTVFATTPWPLSEAAVCLLAGAEKEPLMRSAEHRGVDDDVQEGSSPGCLIPVTAIENVAPCRAAGDFPHAVCGDENFYIIFTSGTTGAPKGVQISHNNLVSFTDWMLSDFDIGSGKRFLLQAPYSFDLSVMSLYPALLTGGTLVVVDPEMALDFRRLFAAIPAMDLDIWVSTPSFADVCLADADFNERANPHITHMIFCGDELTHRTAEKLTDRFPRARVFNTYGPTEATVAVTKIEIDAETLRSHSRLPVGYAKPDMTIAVVDKAGRRLPDGEEGEIIIAGPAVSKGYLNDPVRTAESFFLYQTAPSRQPASGNQTVSVRQPASGNRTAPDRQPAPCNQTASVRQPVSGNQTAPAYHTGDAGIMRGGLLYYKGRLDFQVKFHGYRIEIQDIEQHL
ncbi:MAG: D-alanine--poly(phosphoribitol) ligase subunit DltA, partial [Clostridiales Family XIII bacterium]|nr:D-alanine--poly(phosphoribitol) ligase subunit DltA [Clostridiales Family XIII bacterium]